MKIWIKALISIAVGVILGLFIPADIEIVQTIFSFFSKLAVNLGVYILIPLVFFSLTVEVFELARQKKLNSILLKSMLYLIITTTGLVVIGVLTMLVFHSMEAGISASLSQNINQSLLYTDKLKDVPNFLEEFLVIFPDNFVKVFFSSYGFLLPVGVAAFIIGYNLTFDKFATKPVVIFFDSMSKVLRHINTFFVEISGISISFVTTYFLLSLRLRLANKWISFIPFILFMIIQVVLVIFVVYPLILRIAFKVKNPYKELWAIFVPSVVAFFSGNVLFSHSLLFDFNERNLGTEPVVNTITNSLFAIIGRSGTALVTATTFIMALKINDGLNVTVWAVFYTIFMSIVLSFFTGAIPFLGVPFSLIVMSNIYSNGTEINGVIFLMLPFLAGVGALLDTVTSAFSSYLISNSNSTNRDVRSNEFI